MRHQWVPPACERDNAFFSPNPCLIRPPVPRQGQTGAGKTFSMLGAGGGHDPHRLDGVVPLLVAELFRRVAELKGGEYVVMASYYEIHNSRIYDLLRAPGETNPVALSLRSTGEGFEVSGATLERVHSRQDLLDLVTRASANRAIGTNNVHAHSSRSHAFLTLHVIREPVRPALSANTRSQPTNGTGRPVAGTAQPRQVPPASCHTLHGPRR